jgi:hypothetical protein
MKLRFISLLSVCILTFQSAFAQVRLEPFYSYTNWSFTLAMGSSKMFGDLQHHVSEPMYRLNIERNFNSYTSVGLEVNRGALASEEYKNHWTNGLNQYSQVTNLMATGRVSLGQFFEYVRTGFGMMSDRVSNISYKFRNRDQLEIRDMYSDAIKTSSWIPFIPYNIGFNFHLTKRCEFNVNYQFSYCFSDYVDGYNFPSPPASNYYNDMFSVLSFGLNFYIGQMRNHEYDEKGLQDKVRRFTE